MTDELWQPDVRLRSMAVLENCLAAVFRALTDQLYPFTCSTGRRHQAKGSASSKGVRGALIGREMKKYNNAFLC